MKFYVEINLNKIMLPPTPTQLYLVLIWFRHKISFVTSFTISKWLKKYYRYYNFFIKINIKYQDVYQPFIFLLILFNDSAKFKCAYFTFPRRGKICLFPNRKAIMERILILVRKELFHIRYTPCIIFFCF